MEPAGESDTQHAPTPLLPPPTHVSRAHLLLATLRHLGAPPIFRDLVVQLLRSPRLRGSTRPQLQFLELFAGRAAVTRACQERGLVACPYDITLEPVHHNFLGDLGFLQALLLVLQLEPGAGLHCATVCSTWTAVNSGTHRRSKASPLGETRHQSVRDGNLMATRTALVLYLAHAVGVVRARICRCWDIRHTCACVLGCCVHAMYITCFRSDTCKGAGACTDRCGRWNNHGDPCSNSTHASSG
jgi:hypothetical protein